MKEKEKSLVVDSQLLRSCIGISIVPTSSLSKDKADQSEFPICIGLRRTVPILAKYKIKHPVLCKNGNDPKGNQVKWIIGIGKSVATIAPNQPLEFYSTIPIVAISASQTKAAKEIGQLTKKNEKAKDKDSLVAFIGKQIDLSTIIVQKGISSFWKNVNTEGYYRKSFKKLYDGIQIASNRSFSNLQGWYREYFEEKGYHIKHLESQMRELQGNKKKP
jgi:hypothetical protein